MAILHSDDIQRLMLRVADQRLSSHCFDFRAKAADRHIPTCITKAQRNECVVREFTIATNEVATT